jgi:hypothetical protein
MESAIDQKLADELATVPTGASTDAGVRVGHLAAAFMLAARTEDGSAAVPPPFSLPAVSPGAYQLTPPNQPTPVFTNWGAITPFVMDAGDEFRPPAPPDLTSLTWAQAIDEVQKLGQDAVPPAPRSDDRGQVLGAADLDDDGTRSPTAKSWGGVPAWRRRRSSSRR